MNASARASVRRDAVALACLVAATGVAGQLSKAAPAPGRGLAARSEIAGPCDGSSNPTFLSNNRRLATTAGRRVLALYDPHGSGQQLVWRDRGRGWSTRTRGAVADGFMPGDRGGDRPASIALARDAAGRQHAWVVWGGHDFGHLLSVEMRRLSQLDRAGGPRVGPELTIARAGNRGHARPTIAFERGRRGPKGVVAWLGRAESSYDLVVQWFTNLNDDTPRMHHRTVLFSSGRASPTPTLVAGRRGTRLVTTTPAGRLAVFAHRAGTPLRHWRKGRARIKVARSSLPSAVRWRRGSILVALQRGRAREGVAVVRFGRRLRRARIVLKAPGHRQPTLARAGKRAYLVMVRARDSAVVSRRLSPRGRWTRRDRVEIVGGSHAWPNALSGARRELRFIVQGRPCATNPNAHAVIAYWRRA